MIYAQFFNGTSKDTEATGDRSVVILDGRFSRITHVKWARAECGQRGYKAWQLMKGRSFTTSRALTEIVPLT